ncbi:MAG: HNH endonuclease signature motif containing protein, partial [Iamia sp.]
DRWAGDLDLSGIDGEIVANAIDTQISALWNDGVFTRDDGLDPSERRAIALVQVIERGTRGGDDDGTARPLVLALTTRDVLTRPPAEATPADPPAAGGAGEGHTAGGPRDQAEGTSGPGTTGGHDRPGTGPPSAPTPAPGPPDPSDHGQPSASAAAAATAALGAPNSHGDHTRGTLPPPWPLPDDDRRDTGPSPDPADPLADLDPLTPYPAMLSELARSGPVHPDIVRRLACEGTVIPVYVGDGADQLNMGRTIRLANRTQRRNLRLRDGCCQFPGCSVAPEWCIAHHLVWWDDGGTTDMINLVLLCRYHHRLVHGGGFTMTRGPDGTLITTRTDHHILTPALAPVAPVIRAQPPPPPIDLDTDEIPFRQVQYMTRCRIDDLVREAENRRGCRRRDPTDTTRLRC